jgi:hypothetical protein
MITEKVEIENHNTLLNIGSWMEDRQKINEKLKKTNE